MVDVNVDVGVRAGGRGRVSWLSSTSPGRLLLYWLWKRAPGEGKGKVRTRVRVRVRVRVKARVRVRVRVEARALVEEQRWVHGAP